jgi:uncharacterized protein YndB with AHSA1/START domain
MSRSHETRIVIDATAADVWKALTDPAEASRWFAPRMEIDAREGGQFVADWGPGLRWATTCEILEPERHLRLSEVRSRVFSAASHVSELEPARLLQDFYLETENGKTVLRLVHSGFGSSDGWDVEYDGTRQGWRACFLRLKLALERHRGLAASNFIISWECRGATRQAALSRVQSNLPEGFVSEFQGETEFAGIVPGWNHSVFNVSSQPLPEGSVLYLEFILWGVASAQAEELEALWRGRMAAWFPAA